MPTSPKKQNQELFSASLILASLVSGFIGFLAASILFLFRAPTNPDTPIIIPSTSETALPMAGSCQDLAGEELTTCCETWATENNVIRPYCVGDWTLENGVCSWTCEAS